MKHILPLFLLALALIGCEKNGIDYDIVAGHTYARVRTYPDEIKGPYNDTIVFIKGGNTQYKNRYWEQKDNLVSIYKIYTDKDSVEYSLLFSTFQVYNNRMVRLTNGAIYNKLH